MNQTQIAATLCENKAKPALECDGKCYLRKQIQKQEQKDQAPVETSELLWSTFCQYNSNDWVVPALIRTPTTPFWAQASIPYLVAWIPSDFVPNLLRPPNLPF